jgi:MCP family monocarboxylic acid transporter-like MFS transporter 10
LISSASQNVRLICDTSWGALNVHCGVTLVSSFFVLLLWTFSTTTGTALSFVILFGMVSGAVIGLPPASVADILGHCPTQQAKVWSVSTQIRILTNIQQLGQWTGMMYSVAAPFALLGPVIGGYLITKYNTFLTIQLWSGSCLLLSAEFMSASIWSRWRQQKIIDDENGMMTMSEAVTRQPSELSMVLEKK